MKNPSPVPRSIYSTLIHNCIVQEHDDRESHSNKITRRPGMNNISKSGNSALFYSPAREAAIDTNSSPRKQSKEVDIQIFFFPVYLLRIVLYALRQWLVRNGFSGYSLWVVLLTECLKAESFAFILPNLNLTTHDLRQFYLSSLQLLSFSNKTVAS